MSRIYGSPLHNRGERNARITLYYFHFPNFVRLSLPETVLGWWRKAQAGGPYRPAFYLSLNDHFFPPLCQQSGQSEDGKFMVENGKDINDTWKGESRFRPPSPGAPLAVE